MISLQQFIDKYSNKPNVGDTPENRGQCVGLVEVWDDELGNEPHIWGNAADLMANADRSAFDVIPNTPNGVPSPGDIFCFDGYYGNGAGHTGVVVSANLNNVTLFEQNDPEGSTPHLKTYSYDHAQGWIHPHVLNQTNQGNTMLVIDAKLLEQTFSNLLFRAPDPSTTGDYIGKEFLPVWNDILTSPERAAVVKRYESVTGLESNITDLQGQLKDLKAQNQSQQDVITQLNGQLKQANNGSGPVYQTLDQYSLGQLLSASFAKFKLFKIK